MAMSRFIIEFGDRLDGHFWEKVFTQNPEQAHNGRPKLVTPPPVPGDYLHKEQLTDDEKEWAKRR